MTHFSIPLLRRGNAFLPRPLAPSSMECDVTEAKTCLRCGQSISRKVMATAKYCSAECRQRCAKEAYEKRQKFGKLGMIAAQAQYRRAVSHRGDRSRLQQTTPVPL
jgi:hypothetical protein